MNSGVCNLVLPLSVDIAVVISQGKLYPWPRPRRCPRCGGMRLWGHGYVARYLDDTVEPLWMKRWCCVECGAVHTVRPTTHWRRFWAPITLICLCLSAKSQRGRWQPGICRQRQQYWWHGYQMQSLFDGSPAAGVETLIDTGIIAATHSLTDRAIIPWPDPPHPSFAATAAPGPP